MSFFQALVAEQESKDSGGASIAEQVLSIMEIILDEANAEISEDKVLVYHRFMHLSETEILGTISKSDTAFSTRLKP